MTYVTLPNGSFLASEIALESRPNATPAIFSITDRLNAIDGNRWTIGPTTITITGDTAIVDKPVVGDTVEVLGKMKFDGEIIADSIRALRLKETQFQDPIEQITQDYWIVGGKYVII